MKKGCASLLASAGLTLALAGTVGCTDSMGSMAASYCDVSGDDYLLDPHNDGEPVPPIDCNFTKGQVRKDGTCRHLGGNWKHNWAADYWGNQLFPDSGDHTKGTQDDYGYGCDATFKTGGTSVSLDGYMKSGNAKPILFEMKTGGYEAIQAKYCPAGVKQQMLDKLENDFKNSIMKEEPIAVRCGMKYQIVFSDRTFARKATDYVGNDANVDVEICDGCRNPPSQPDGYTSTSSVSGDESARRFSIDGEGQLQSQPLDDQR